MNKFEAEKRFTERIKETYPPGTRLVLLSMDDPYALIPSGTKGTVVHVDDQAQIHMKWDNGRTLAIVPGEDSFRKLTERELAEEQQAAAEEKNNGMDEDNAPVMGM